jgi:hypothetical protein
MRGPIVHALTLAAAGVVVVACTMSYPPCYRGEYRGCTCATASGPVAGYQACTVTEDTFEACVCDGTTPGLDGGRDASASDAAEAGDAAGEGAPYLAPCPNGLCSGADLICFTFGNKGKVCTKRCAGPTDCPPPSLGCSPMMGVCRPP